MGVVVMQQHRAAYNLLPAICVALAATSGCATRWLLSPDEAELPIPNAQKARVYAKGERAKTDKARASTAADRGAGEKRSAEISLEPLLPQSHPASSDLLTDASARWPGSSLSENRLRQAAADPVDNELRSEFVERKADAEPAREERPASSIAPPPEIKLVSAEGDSQPSPSDQKTLAAEKTVPAETPKPPAYQTGDWLKAHDEAIRAIEQELALARLDTARADEVARLETLLRLHYAMLGRRDDAAKPVKELKEQEREFWRLQGMAISDLLGADRLPNESRRYAVALRSLEEAESHLAAAGSLTLRNMALCRKVQDFGVVDRFKATDFSRNQEVILYVEVRNFAAHQRDDHSYETELQGSFRVLDRTGVARAERTLPLDKQTCANLRRDYYIAYRLYIPSELSPGSYTLELTIEDRKGHKSNNALLDFNVTP
jgi:hypothetical protein